MFLPIGLVIIAFSLANLGSTANHYLSPSLEVISDRLKCSESLAGVTLLALGNGAPDVFSAIAAGSGADGDSLFAIQLSIWQCYICFLRSYFFGINVKRLN